MPITHTIDVARRLIITTAEGPLKVEDLVAHQKRLSLDPAFDPDFDHIFDGTNITDMDAPTDDLRWLASIRVFSSDAKRAVVAPKTLGFGLARMYEGFQGASSHSFAVFRSTRDALRWLGHKS